MKKILYINGNPQEEHLSYSRKAGNYYLKQREKVDPNVTIEILNVYDEALQLIDGDVLDAWGKLRNGDPFSELTIEQQTKLSRMGQVLEQFKAADEYVFITPLWNFSIPPMLKAYIDNVMIAGETFKYTSEGPVGLLGDKKATIIQASGGVYSEEPAAGYEHGSNLIKDVLGFMGLKAIDTVLIEGIAMPGKTEEERMEEVYRDVDGLFEIDFV